MTGEGFVEGWRDQVVGDGTAGSATWCGEPVLAVDGDGWRVLISPQRGGKIVSLRQGGREWLAQPVRPLPAPAEPGASFVEAEMCGWDECAPSIEPCQIGDRGVPDHGDLWTQRWWVAKGLGASDRSRVTTCTDATVSDHGQWLRAHGPSLEYEFARRVVPGGPTVRLEYRAWVIGVGSRAGVPFLWAAHPQFLAPPGTVVEVGVEEGTAPKAMIDQDQPLVRDIPVLDVMSSPVSRLALTPQLRSIDTVEVGGCRKVYVEPGAPVDWVRLVHPDGAGLTVRWDRVNAPYLGLWFDRGAYSRDDVIALEPSTGFYDSVTRAVDLGRVPVLVPGTVLAWWCDLSFT